MRRNIFSTLICILMMLMLSSCAESSSLPRFTWPSFQRFWNARSMPGAALKEGQVVEHGREISFGNTLKVFVWIEEERVRGVRVRYFDPSGQHELALLFVRVVQSAVAAGSFRWPQDKVLEARQLFYEMKEDPLEYRFMVTVFKRFYVPESGWEFSFIYALPEEDISHFKWPDENPR